MSRNTFRWAHFRKCEIRVLSRSSLLSFSIIVSFKRYSYLRCPILGIEHFSDIILIPCYNFLISHFAFFAFCDNRDRNNLFFQFYNPPNYGYYLIEIVGGYDNDLVFMIGDRIRWVTSLFIIHLQ